MVTKAEGEKQSMILTAEARLESAKRDAEAQVMLAEASRQGTEQQERRQDAHRAGQPDQ
jgi:hypothetical protein